MIGSKHAYVIAFAVIAQAKYSLLFYRKLHRGLFDRRTHNLLISIKTALENIIFKQYAFSNLNQKGQVI